MTLSTDSVRHSAGTARASHTAKPHGHKAAAEAPLAPFEPADSVQIASPEQASKAVAATPVLDPALQCALLTGVMQVAGSIQGSAIPLVTVDAALKGMGSKSYTLDLKSGDQPLTSTGSEKIAASGKDQAMYTNGPDTELRLALDEKSKKLQVDGKLEGFATHLQISMNPPADKDDDVQGFHTEGTIGGQKYTLDSNFSIDPSTRPPEPPPEDPKAKKHKKQEDEAADDAPAGPPPPPELGTMQATGQIGDQQIKANYKFSEQQQPFGATMDFKGSTGDVHLSLIA